MLLSVALAALSSPAWALPFFESCGIHRRVEARGLRALMAMCTVGLGWCGHSGTPKQALGAPWLSNTGQEQINPHKAHWPRSKRPGLGAAWGKSGLHPRVMGRAPQALPPSSWSNYTHNSDPNEISPEYTKSKRKLVFFLEDGMRWLSFSKVIKV